MKLWGSGELHRFLFFYPKNKKLPLYYSSEYTFGSPAFYFTNSRSTLLLRFNICYRTVAFRPSITRGLALSCILSLYLLHIILFIIVNKNCLFLPIRCILATQPLIPPSTPSHIDHPHIKNAPTSVNGAWEVIVQFIGNVKQSCNYADFILFGKCQTFKPHRGTTTYWHLHYVDYVL